MTEPLKAYVVTSASEDAETGSALVYARTEAQAKHLGCREIGLGGCEYEEARAIRDKKHDERAAKMPDACVERDNEYLRNAGWHLEDEYRCDACGLAPMGIDKYAVCRLSNVCRECGCDTERLCGADGVDEAGHCTRCGLVPEDGVECPPGFLTDVDPPCTHEEGWSCE